MSTFEFTQYRPPATVKQKAPVEKPRLSNLGSKPIEPPPTPEPGVDVPEGAGLNPYWWT